MIGLRLLPVLLLAACATQPTATRFVTLQPEVPQTLLACADAPAVPQASSQSAVAAYIVALWQAGQDCRAHLKAVQTVLKVN